MGREKEKEKKLKFSRCHARQTMQFVSVTRHRQADVCFVVDFFFVHNTTLWPKVQSVIMQIFKKRLGEKKNTHKHAQVSLCVLKIETSLISIWYNTHHGKFLTEKNPKPHLNLETASRCPPAVWNRPPRHLIGPYGAACGSTYLEQCWMEWTCPRKSTWIPEIHPGCVCVWCFHCCTSAQVDSWYSEELQGAFGSRLRAELTFFTLQNSSLTLNRRGLSCQKKNHKYTCISSRFVRSQTFPARPVWKQFQVSSFEFQPQLLRVFSWKNY